MLLLAHRGASAEAPENTLEAFELAAAQGADGVEFDVMRCGSGEIVVCHDERLGRLAGLDVEVAKTPYRELSRIDVGSRLGFAPARIPLLSEVVEALPAKLLLNVELKSDRLNDGGLSLAVGDYLTRAGLQERVVVSSFNPYSLWRLARAFGQLRRGYLVAPERSHFIQAQLLAPLCANYAMHPHESACNEWRVLSWHARGWKVAVWTVDEPERARALRQMGIDYLITNRPKQLREALG